MSGNQREEGYFDNQHPPRGRGAQGPPRGPARGPQRGPPQGPLRGRGYRGGRGDPNPTRGPRGGNRGYPNEHHRGTNRGGPDRGRTRSGGRGRARKRTNRGHAGRGAYDNRNYNGEYQRSYTDAATGKIPVITGSTNMDDTGAAPYDDQWDSWEDGNETYQQDHQQDHQWHVQDVQPQAHDIREQYSREDDQGNKRKPQYNPTGKTPKRSRVDSEPER